MNIEKEKKLLLDILIAVNSIDDHLQNQRDFKLYLSNKTQRRAVERELEIIGEALKNILNFNPSIQISYARLIVNMRNKVIHAYDNIDDIIIWKVIMKDLPILKDEVTHLLALDN